MVIKKEKIKDILKPIIISTLECKCNKVDIRRNTIDVFSQSIQRILLDLSEEDWIKSEEIRQKQKTLQNQIGDLHQNILGTIEGITNLKIGNIVDLKGTLKDGTPFFAEIKNKHNTTKGNHKVMIYDDLNRCIINEIDKKTIGYYVEILPLNGKRYDEPFTPSDNKSHTKRIKNNNIRRIDGNSFYEKITGYPNALENVYKLIIIAISEILEEDYSIKRNYKKYLNIKEFDLIYKN